MQQRFDFMLVFGTICARQALETLDSGLHTCNVMGLVKYCVSCQQKTWVCSLPPAGPPPSIHDALLQIEARRRCLLAVQTMVHSS